jgi:cytochrome c biogenesis factor
MLRREIPILLAMIVGWFMVGEFFFPWAEPGGTEVQQMAVIITATGVILGVANVIRINLLKVSRREKDWRYSILLLVGLGVMAFLGTLLPVVHAALHGGEWKLGPFNLVGITDGTLFDRLYNRVYVPLSATMYGLLAFYIASAAFRAFRVRTVDAGLLAAAAIIVMIGRVPLGEKIWDGIPLLTDWIMNVPQLAAKRAILIGAALGGIATGLKILLGIERNFLGSD